MVVVVDPDLATREELLVSEACGRAPLPRRRPRALLAQKTPQAPEELIGGERSTVGGVLCLTLSAQQPREVVEEPPVGGEVEVDRDPCGAVHALDVVGRMPGREGRGPAEVAF